LLPQGLKSLRENHWNDLYSSVWAVDKKACHVFSLIARNRGI
jgi:hypothetical protein